MSNGPGMSSPTFPPNPAQAAPPGPVPQPAPVPAGAPPMLEPLGNTLKADVAELVTGSTKAKVPTGFPRLDRAIDGGLRELTIFAGAPGVGKSSWALAVALHAAATGHPTLYYSLEMPRREQVKRALVSRSAFGTWAAMKERDHYEKAADYLREKCGRFLYVVDQGNAASVSVATMHAHLANVRAVLKAHVEKVAGAGAWKNPAPLVVVDHARLVHVPGYADELARQEQLLADLLDLTQTTGAAVLLVHELNKAGMEGMKLESVKGSVSAVYNAALVVGLVDPAAKEDYEALPEYQDAAESGDRGFADAPSPKALRLVVRKNRYGPSGFTIPCEFHAGASRFREWTREESGRARQAEESRPRR